MSTDKFHDCFKGEISDYYSRYRPTYPEAVYDTIISYHKQSGQAAWDLAVDVGCGTGQSTQPLAKYFKKVIGVDVSADQLALCSKSNSNVTFHMGPAEDLSFLEANSVDLITAATAAHWMDRDRFAIEAYRVLKPQGTLTFYSYEYEHFEDELVEQYINKMRWEVFADYQFINSTTIVIKEKYRNLTLPLMEDFKRLDVATVEADWTIDQYLCFLQSHHFCNGYLRDHPDHDVLGEMKEELTRLLSCGNKTEKEIRIRPRWEFFMVIGRKPL